MGDTPSDAKASRDCNVRIVAAVPQMNPRIVEPSSEAEAELNAFLDKRIYKFNIRATGFRDGRPFAGVIKDESANVIAAISGHT